MKKYYPLIIIALFALQFIFINPLGEFALNDDWVHTDTIRHWVETGEFRMLPFAGPTFYVPILYGSLLVKLFGFSFSLLRISTLAITLALLLLYYALLNKITKNPLWSFISVLLLWFNPIFYNLTFTFMSDVPALFLFIAALYCYWRGFDEQKPALIFIGSLISITGFYTRQTNILLFAASGIFALTQTKHIHFRNILWSFGVPLVIGIAIYIFLMKNNLLPQGTALHILNNPVEIGRHALWWIWYSIVYVGFFVMPIFFGWITKNYKTIKLKNWIVPALAVIIALILRQTLHVQFPYILNIINVNGLGPMHNVLNGSLLPVLSSKVWAIVTLLSAASGAWFFTRILSPLPRGESKGGEYLFNIFNIFLVLYLIPILLFESFDRYYLPLFVVATIIVLNKIKEEHNSVQLFCASLVILLFAIFSISQTQFYLNWNKARWNMATRILNETKLEPHHIDGGYEWDGWHAYWSAHDSGLKNGAWTAPWWIRNLFVNNTEDYIVSWSPIRPYEVVEKQHIRGWNPNNTLYLLKKP